MNNNDKFTMIRVKKSDRERLNRLASIHNRTGVQQMTILLDVAYAFPALDILPHPGDTEPIPLIKTSLSEEDKKHYRAYLAGEEFDPRD